ncbi:sequestosome-1 [Anaeramoeba flamelloides]|uniref:Sequestosome-1 n=1 Tax=Anaeramoeba flamelloides TaxID=1746091 RepID=A0ABQ8YVL8_9EUKA|nr:sequestosome-1 [Anaeramoeba flamelloides]
MTNLNETTEIPIKVYFNNNYRRFTIPKECRISNLFKVLEDALGINFIEEKNKYTFHYYDEEDEVVIFSSDPELKEALKFALQNDPPLFRFSITTDKFSSSENQNEKEKEKEKEEKEKKENIEEKKEQKTTGNDGELVSDFQFPEIKIEQLQQIQDFIFETQEEVFQLTKNKSIKKWLKFEFINIIDHFQRVAVQSSNEKEKENENENEFQISVEFFFDLFNKSKIEETSQDQIIKLLTAISNKIIEINNNSNNFPFKILFQRITELPIQCIVKTLSGKKCYHTRMYKKNEKEKIKQEKIRGRGRRRGRGRGRGRGKRHGRGGRRGRGGKGRHGRGGRKGRGKNHKFKGDMKNEWYDEYPQINKEDNKITSIQQSQLAIYLQLPHKKEWERKQLKKQELKNIKTIEKMERKKQKMLFRFEKKMVMSQLREQKKLVKSQFKQNRKKMKNQTNHIFDDSQYDQQLIILQNIGFQNHELNLKYLKLFNGNLNKTTNALLEKK